MTSAFRTLVYLIIIPRQSLSQCSRRFPISYNYLLDPQTLLNHVEKKLRLQCRLSEPPQIWGLPTANLPPPSPAAQPILRRSKSSLCKAFEEFTLCAISFTTTVATRSARDPWISTMIQIVSTTGAPVRAVSHRLLTFLGSHARAT